MISNSTDEMDRKFEDVLKYLQLQGLDFIVTGGLSLWKQFGLIRSYDVDLGILPADFEQIEKYLRDSDRIKFQHIEKGRDIISVRTKIDSYVFDLEFIRPEAFCGTKSPEGFITYSKNYRSRTIGGIRYANQELSLYMRLSIPDYIIYISKTVQNAKELAEGKMRFDLGKIIEVAEYFGRKEKIANRVNELMKWLDEAGLGYVAP